MLCFYFSFSFLSFFFSYFLFYSHIHLSTFLFKYFFFSFLFLSLFSYYHFPFQLGNQVSIFSLSRMKNKNVQFIVLFYVLCKFISNLFHVFFYFSCIHVFLWIVKSAFIIFSFGRKFSFLFLSFFFFFSKKST